MTNFKEGSQKRSIVINFPMPSTWSVHCSRITTGPGWILLPRNLLFSPYIIFSPSGGRDGLRWMQNDLYCTAHHPNLLGPLLWTFTISHWSAKQLPIFIVARPGSIFAPDACFWQSIFIALASNLNRPVNKGTDAAFSAFKTYIGRKAAK